MKRLLLVLLCLAVGIGGVTIMSAAVPAEEAREAPVQTRMSYVNSTLTSISIVNGQAICVGTLIGYQGVTTKVEITLTLQFKTASSSTWSDYYKHPKQTFNTWRGTASCSPAVVRGYQYRTKALYTAYSGVKFESFIEYSPTQSY